MGANPLTSAQATRLLDKRIDKLYWDRYNSLPLVIDKMYDRRSSSKAWEEFYSIGDIPDPERFNGMVQQQSVSMGYHTKIQPLEYAGGITIERLLFDTDQYNIIEKLPKKLADAGNRKMNKIAHEPFIYPDSASFSFVTSEENVALCSNSHTTKTPDVSTSTGFDNLAALAFDGVNLETVRIQSKGFRTDIGERMTSNFDTIIHPTTLASAVWEELNSQGKTGDDLNNANFNKGRYKAIELPLLDDYSTTGWFLVDSSAMKDALIWLDGTKMEFHPSMDYDTMMRKYLSYFRCGWGFTDWRWIIYSEPA